MGFFSFGNKEDAAPTRRGRTSAAAQRSTGRERRPERRGDQETLLDPTLPEKQRARRRLIGAIALVVAAVVILPMVLDSHPKPITGDIAIQIPNRDNAPAARSANAAKAGPTDTADAANDAAPDETPAAQNPPPAAAARTSRASNLAPPAMPRMPPPDNAAATAAADVTPPAPPASPGSRFVVQIGAFPTEQRARAWVTKLKAAGVPAYTEHKKQADGTDRVLLRAGPFTDRASAESAIKKVRAAGLAARTDDSQAAKAPARKAGQ
jgi:DedD protein